MQENLEKRDSWKNYPQQGIDQMLKNVQKVLIAGMGGGGDVLTALHVRWALEKIAPHINWIQGGITGGPVSHYDNIEEMDENSGWVTEKSHGRPPHRLIEAVVSKRIGEKIFLLSCDRGVKNMINSLNALIEAERIEMVIMLDGGTDSLVFLGSDVTSPTEDTMSLAALGLGKYSKTLKYRVAGVSVVGSDAEMTLDDISRQLMKISMAGGYLGGVFFPVERLSEYAEILSDVLQNYPTATAQAPAIITSMQFQRNDRFPYEPIPNGFQLASFLFDAQIVAEVGNAFSHLAFQKESRKAVNQAISKALREYELKEKVL